MVVLADANDVDVAIAALGERIRNRRKALGLSLDKLAECADMSKSYIWEIENGKNKNPTIRTAYNLSRALGWSLAECIGVDPHSDPLSPDAMRIAHQIDVLLREARS